MAPPLGAVERRGLRLRSVSTLDSVAPTLRMSRALSRSRARRVHSCIVLESHGLQPELGDLSVAGQMDMRRLAPIAREEEEPIRAALQNRRTHASDSASFPMNPPGSVAIRLTRSRARGYGDCKGSEVDFIWTRGSRAVGIDVKAASTWRREHGAALKLLMADGVLKSGHGVYTGSVTLKDGPLHVWPLDRFLRELTAGGILE